MKDLFEYIKARLNDRVPEIKTVRIWNNQFLYSRGQKYYFGSEQNKRYRTEKAFPYPACFIEFITEQVYNRSMGIKDILLTVNFRLGVEGYKLERLESFDFCDRFTEAIQLMAPTETSGLTFTTFQKLFTDIDNDHDNVEEPIIGYRTLYRSTAAYWWKKNKTIVNPNIGTTVTIETEL